MIDLNELERLADNLKSGGESLGTYSVGWKTKNRLGSQGLCCEADGRVWPVFKSEVTDNWETRQAIAVALHNAFPELLRLARIGQAAERGT